VLKRDGIHLIFLMQRLKNISHDDKILFETCQIKKVKLVFYI